MKPIKLELFSPSKGRYQVRYWIDENTSECTNEYTTVLEALTMTLVILYMKYKLLPEQPWTDKNKIN